MPRTSVMIPIKSSALRDAFNKRSTPIASLEEPLGVSRQAINGWLSSERIPPRKLSVIAEKLDLSPEEMGLITKRTRSYSVLFRTTRNATVLQAKRNDVIRIARDFFNLDSMRDGPKEDLLVKINTDDPAIMADAILKQIGLTRDALNLDTLIRALERLNIHVLFLDFASVLEFADKETKPRAFCVKEGNKHAIFVDASEDMDDVIWIIFHELAHIFSGHLDDPTICESSVETKEQERFCNRVAVEISTPSAYFIQNKKVLKEKLDCAKPLLPYRLDDLASELRSSFMGVVLALKEHNILTADSIGYLFGVDKKRKPMRAKIHQFIGAPKDQDVSDFWAHTFNNLDHRKFLRLQGLLRRGLIGDSISIGRAAELFGVDEVLMQEMATQWKSEYAEEVVD